MTIGIVSPISTKDLAPWLDGDSRKIAENLSSGIAPAVTTLAIELLKLGHNLVVFTLDSLAEDIYHLNGSNLTIYVGINNYRYRLKRIWMSIGGRILLIRKLLSKYNGKLDVVSAHWTRDYAIASLYYSSMCPIFVTVRDIMPYILTQVPKNIRSYSWIAAGIMNEYVMRNESFHFIANSDYTASSVKKLWGITVPVIYNPVNDCYIHSNNDFIKSESKFTIASISVSPLDDKRKNIISLIKAVQLVRNKYPEVTLYLIGPHFTEGDKAIKDYRKNENFEGIKLLGKLSHPEVIKFLRTANLMAHPSLEETFGNTLVEAMASECATLGGANSGAVPFVLDHGRAGFLCDVENYYDIADKIIYIIEHPDERREKVEYARQYCQNNYSSSIIANRYLNIFSTSLS